jgi:hypothetical protein
VLASAHDVDRVGALELDGLELVLVDLDIFPLAQLVAAAFVGLVDHLADLLVDHLLAQPIAGALVDLVEMRPLGPGRSRIGDADIPSSKGAAP